MRHAEGFSLVEVLIAIAVLTTGVTTIAQLVTIAMRANADAGAITSAALLAQDKMEQLRHLAWGVDAHGAPVRDLTSDISAAPGTPSGGFGLSASPPQTLTQLVAGYCDFVDRFGRSLGSGTSPPADAAYIRRWAVEPLAAFPDSTLILQVRVTRARGGFAGDPASSGSRLSDEIWLVGLRTLKAS